MNTRPATTISYDLTLRLVASSGVVDVPAELRYQTRDPYAVHIVFHTSHRNTSASNGTTSDADSDIEWTFARSLLSEGRYDAAGLGDVQVWPNEADGRPVLCLALSAPTGTALFEADAEHVGVFLDAAYAAVPDGAELAQLDIDASLADLLWRAGRD
jgi:hypothetical protein